MKPQDKLYIVRKYVYAPSARTAILREKKQSVDDVWVDEEWKKNQASLAHPIGFTVEAPQDE